MVAHCPVREVRRVSATALRCQPPGRGLSITPRSFFCVPPAASWFPGRCEASSGRPHPEGRPCRPVLRSLRKPGCRPRLGYRTAERRGIHRNITRGIAMPAGPPPFSAPYAPDDAALAARLLGAAQSDAAQEARIDRTASRLIEAIRANDDPLGGVEDMLREFALSTKEGLALMVLAEALLRVPDAGTADQFIEDRLGRGDFVHHETKSSAFLVNASAWALGVSARVIQPGETPRGTIGQLTKLLGAPAVREATRQAMRLMGSHFVLGETIEAALARARPQSAHHQRYSFDMLGE